MAYSLGTWCEQLALAPDSEDNDCITCCDNQCWNDEDRDGDKRHVQLPVPLVRKFDPALQFFWNIKQLSSYLGGTKGGCSGYLVSLCQGYLASSSSCWQQDI